MWCLTWKLEFNTQDIFVFGYFVPLEQRKADFSSAQLMRRG